MSVLMHLSDPHFGTEVALVVRALVELARQQSPDLLVLSGDITQRAEPAQFRAARAFMDRLGAPMVAVPGNHDIPLLNAWVRLCRPYARHVAAFGADLEPRYASPDLMAVCVNTTRAWRHQNGEVSGLQVERVAQTLERAAVAQLRIVVVHQPAAVPHAKDAPHRLRGHAAALARWAAAGADLVLGGHIHLPYVMPLHGLARPMWVVQAGTAVSSRVRKGAPNSVNLVRWGKHAAPGRCVIEQWDFSAHAQAFVRVGLTEVCPARG